MDKPRIMFVDDDQEILAAYARAFRKRYAVEVAAGPEVGLDMLRAGLPVAVVVSDLRMPGMDGVEFLGRVREIRPEAVRIILTGFADIGVAMAAVNKSKVFSFLTKPCPEADLEEALAAALRQYQLLAAEKELLRGTVRGTIKLLTNLLEMVNPEAFGKSSRVKRLAVDLGAYLGVEDAWRLELAAMLSQIGCAAMPAESLRRAYRGEPLPGDKAYEFAMHPRIAADLVSNIPRLREVAEIIAYQEKRYDGGGLPPDGTSGERIPLGARILKVALDFDTLEALYRYKRQSANPVAEALDRMGDREGWYDPDVFGALQSLATLPDGFEPRLVPVEELAPGMLLDQDVLDLKGELALSRGLELNTVSIRRLAGQAGQTGKKARWRVLVPPAEKLAFAKILDG
ncbi:response regulator receiver protein [Solidesulfovibrio carbinoliphilus subsp. oakridgensis]|uniref:Response regulator receiver protein n=1 Tax=Solidesulfovibrio carbinoliphilus subsp. oakridgensis TaxID=694327 RepID=G7Q780_9BACT|nr:HD domain-containing phosphohydrolase [Solidesulfovibrio carbinoliphilus]EHJ49037.1 response regulator receiver protein [Solidesulfovibrio carbinoliphilus subsp. oakridgensis]